MHADGQPKPTAREAQRQNSAHFTLETQTAACGGSCGTSPGPANDMPLAKPAAVNITVNTNIRIAIFMINFLQYICLLQNFSPGKLRIDYMKNRSEIQELKLHAIFRIHPHLRQIQRNEFHSVNSILRLTTNNSDSGA